jgi:hypothetical protein
LARFDVLQIGKDTSIAFNSVLQEGRKLVCAEEGELLEGNQPINWGI